MDRFSKKRQAILDCLRGTKSHPTAEWIFARLKPVYPDLSLATVYRNLHQLMECGEIRSVGVFEGKEHFDAMAAAHPHVICTRCGAVEDVPEVEVPSALSDTAQKATGYEISEATLQFYGVCRTCRTKS